MRHLKPAGFLYILRVPSKKYSAEKSCFNCLVDKSFFNIFFIRKIHRIKPLKLFFKKGVTVIWRLVFCLYKAC